MPELRSGVRRARASVIDKKKNAASKKRSEHLVGKYVKTRAAEKKEAVEEATVVVKVEAKEQKKPKPRRTNKKENEGLVTAVNEPVILVSEHKVEIEKKVVMADGSGGLSANKVTGQEEEGNTAPFPGGVCFLLSVFQYFCNACELI